MRKVVIASPVATQSGYGHHAREIINNLIEQRGQDWDIRLVSLPWGHTPFTYPLSVDIQNRIVPLPLTEQPDVWVQVTVPNEFQAVGKINIGVTAGTEGDICPPQWIDNLNSMQLVIVPSEFTKQVFETTAKNHGKFISTPIEVIPEYFDEMVYTDAVKNGFELSILNEIPETFAFLSVGHWLHGPLGEDRKNTGGVVHCFFNTFKNQKNQPALILKTSSADFSAIDREDLLHKLNQIIKSIKTTQIPNIYLLHGDLTDEEMNSLYNHPKVKAHITFTKGEGYGRPLAEAGRSEKPIIATNWSGHVDFLKNAILLPGTLTNVHPSAAWQDVILQESQWFSVDYGYAIGVMRSTFEKYKDVKDLGKKQSYHIKKNFSLEAMDTRLNELIDEFVPEFPKQVALQLPQLKKISLPQLKKIN